MKKLLQGVACLLLPYLVTAQTYTSGHLTVSIIDSMSHDSVNCRTNAHISCSISIDSSYLGETVSIIDTSLGILGTFTNTAGASPWIFTTPFLISKRQWDYFISGGYISFT